MPSSSRACTTAVPLLNVFSNQCSLTCLPFCVMDFVTSSHRAQPCESLEQYDHGSGHETGRPFDTRLVSSTACAMGQPTYI
ncbi:hypothetical protein HBI56_150310 [Parastagonospora nodorum]|uniref:Uncharacterized protein n=1 Tax=Phaeosphaeria nodorum (strain SN15 / ATCC MYA-4574 / FGSC 10173) TaxID=321614 RepID=A0A7U2FF22_PHANO|nr:hypothetical protein HBH56_184220 [Parastagonospora nodorum]QRD04081.1 hypothetical protein JI435_420680 [Parastagonospora nodorum SN15]KAH3926042.1 hypothetical protein HBH54_173370 [Parastagonospora nodorum]KAH3944774.1 hypothetical protein HBH53_151570 [Parastagonospora nodorum]KAH3962410.1 hypothetical protein HBH52_224850 [Parastagonospora nodorum]